MRRFLEAAAILVVGIFAVIAVAVLAPPLFVPEGLATKDAATIENDVRGTLLQGLLGAAFLLAAYFIWRQVQIAERGQITARFKDAIDQLGSESADVRLGGIYSVEQIAKDNPKTYGTLMVEILGAFVRRRSQLPESTESESVLPVDIEASLRVLLRRKSPSRSSLDLTRAWLNGAHLRGADLTAANLRGAHLIGADLPDAHLRGAHLRGADLTRANLRGAYLPDAHLRGADLTGAHLTDADLIGADLTDADLTDANLRGANLTGAHLNGANLRAANLTDADLRAANLTDADLRGVHLDGANLRGVHLDGANLRAAHLDGADLRGANLTGHDLDDFRSRGAIL